MVLFLFLTLIAGLIVCREKRGGAEFFVGLYALAGILLCLAGLEIVSGLVDPLKSDELFYIETATTVEAIDLFEKQRAVWHGVNYWVLNVDFGLNGLALKVVNIPLYALLVFCLFRIFDRRRVIWLLPIFLPYSLWVSTFNLRDVPIQLTTILVAFLYAKPGAHKYYAIIPLMILYKLRPFAALFLCAVVGAVELLILLRSVLSGVVAKRAIVGITAGGVFAGLVIAVFWQPISEVTISYYNWFIFTTGEGRIEHLERIASAYKSQNILGDFIVAMVRYAATPIPTSILERALEGGSDLWGLIDDVVRLFHQTVYYAMVIYLLVHWQYAISVWKELRKEQRILIYTFLSYWPIYSFHLYGVTHQRSKLPLQIVVFLIVMLIWGRRSSAQSHQAVIDDDRHRGRQGILST